MGKATEGKIDFVLKRKRDETTTATNDPLPLLELEQQQQNHAEGRTDEPVIFRGVEFLQRDPGLRPQIWEYPPEQRDSVRRAYMLLGPMQPRLTNYKLSGKEGHQRRFQFSWFGLFPSWLEYSEDKDCAYCLFCFLANNKETVRGGSHVFTVGGFNRWKRISGKNCAFLTHNGILQERFFDLIHVANTRSLTLKDELTAVLSTHGFDIQNLRGQGYDGASNMRGELNGLQALFLRECPYAYYVHCYAHRLQLALVDASKEVVPITQFFQKLIFVINTADSSSKRHDELHLAQVVELENGISNGSIETGQGANQILALKRPGDTRWGSHFAAVHSLMNLFGVVYSHIQDIAADGSTLGTIRADADTSFGYLSSFEFIFILCLMKETFEITEILGQAVQKKSQDIVNAVRLVSSTKQCLQELRSDDGYQQFMDTVIEFCVNHSIEIPDFDQTYILRGGRARHQPDKLTKEHYFRVEIFRATLDTQLFELNRRFNEKVMDLLSTCATLIPKYKFKGFKASDICEVVKKYYPADFAQDIYGLQQQLKHFVADASKDEELKNISTLIDLCRCLVETGRHTIYNLIDRLLRLLITLPVSTATAERAFSSMKIIKTRLRNKMEDENLTNQMLINIEGGILENYSYDDVIEYFKKTKNRSADL